MANSLLIAGIVCIVAAVVGGGIKLLGNELPALGSTRRQVLLAAVGLAFLIASYMVARPKSAPLPTPSPAEPSISSPTTPAPTTASSSSFTPRESAPSTPPISPQAATPVAPAPERSSPVAATRAPSSACGPSNGLDCLPKSSRPVEFRDPAAANETAARNIAAHLSTTAGQLEAQRAGASGKASRLCGIVASYDSSPLGKHLAAVALADRTAEGEASEACLRMAQNFL